MLDRQTVFFLVIGVAVVNGLFSPYLHIAVPIVAVLMPELFPKEPGWVLFFSSILVSTTTLLVAGIPAAIHERHFESDPESARPNWTWLVAAAVMTLPALPFLSL